MKNLFRASYLRENLFGRLPFLRPLESIVLRFFMIPNLFLVRAKGLKYVRESKGPAIFAFNHNNSVETILVPAFLVYHSSGRKISFVIDWMFGKIPLLEQLFKPMEPIYVYHKRSPLRLLEARRPKHVPPADTVSLCCEKLMAGKRIGIFPEGKRNKDPFRLLKAKPGIGHIALRSEVPVIPVGINCTRGKKNIKVSAFGRILLTIGKPMRFESLSEAYRNAAKSSSPHTAEHEQHLLAREATNRVMHVIAGLCGKELTVATNAETYGNTENSIRQKKTTTIPPRRSYVLYNG